MGVGVGQVGGDGRVLGHGLAVAPERAPLAFEDVDLGLHERGTLRQRDELGTLFEELRGVLGMGDLERGELVGRRGPARHVARRLGLGLFDEQIHLREFGIQVADVVHQPAGELSQAGGRRGHLGVGHRVRGSLGRSGIVDQSSGIRIQPWRMAYTTAWVRSLTDSLRRIELMWFLTVCSLIDSA